MAKFTPQQCQDLRQARFHLIACKQQLQGAKTHLEQFVLLMTPFAVNMLSYHRMLTVFKQCADKLTQAQRRIEEQMPERDLEMKVTYSDVPLQKDSFWSPELIRVVLIAVGVSLPGLFFAMWFISWLMK